MSYRREMYLIPREVCRKIYQRYGDVVLGEFTRLLDAYNEHWENVETGEGFCFAEFSSTVLPYFDMIQEMVDARNCEYFKKAIVLADNVEKARQEKINKQKERERKGKWYVDNSVNVNQKRRKKYASEKTNKKNEPSSDASSERVAPLENKRRARKLYNRTQNYGIMETVIEFKNHNWGSGDFVDKSGVCHDDCRHTTHDQTGSLSGRNRAGGTVVREAVSRKPAVQEAVKGAISHSHKRSRKPYERGKGSHRGSEPAPLSRNAPQVAQKLGNSVVSPPALRLTVYEAESIIIGDDFEVDLFDRYFKPFGRADRYLKNGFEKFARANWVGMRKDKFWLRKQFFNFAVRQKKEKIILTNLWV